MATPDSFNLRRFVDAQQGVFEIALSELRQGSKLSHWMWFIFPQLAGLGRSPTASYYGIDSLDEASAYLRHPLLGTRLRTSVEALQAWVGRRTADEILGAVDAVKLRSCLTLFDRAEPHSLFAEALLNFFGGTRDELTLALLDRQH